MKTVLFLHTAQHAICVWPTTFKTYQMHNIQLVHCAHEDVHADDCAK